MASFTLSMFPVIMAVIMPIIIMHAQIKFIIYDRPLFFN
jgi:hypothetical protein